MRHYKHKVGKQKYGAPRRKKASHKALAVYARHRGRVLISHHRLMRPQWRPWTLITNAAEYLNIDVSVLRRWLYKEIAAGRDFTMVDNHGLGYVNVEGLIQFLRRTDRITEQEYARMRDVYPNLPPMAERFPSPPRKAKKGFPPEELPYPPKASE